MLILFILIIVAGVFAFGTFQESQATKHNRYNG